MFSFTSIGQVKALSVIGPPNVNSELEVQSTTKGILLPRLALVSSTSFSPMLAHVEGMFIYNTATVADVTPGIYHNDGSKWIKSGGGTLSTNNLAVQNLPVTFNNINWNINSGSNARVNLNTANANLIITNTSPGGYGTIIAAQDATGNRNITFPTNSKTMNGNSISNFLSTSPNTIDVLSFYYDGTYFYWVIGKNAN
jgi:hypothetical protein